MRALHLLFAGALAFGSVAFAAVDQSLLNLVPAGTKVLAGFQVDQGKISPFGQFLLAQTSRHEPEFQQLLDQTGFDPRRDLQEVLIASTGSESTPHHGPPAVILARGTFDPAHIKTALLARGGHVTNFAGVEVMTGKNANDAGCAFLDDNLAVAGPLDAVRGVINNRNSPTQLDTLLEQKVSSISQTNEAWFASILPGTQLPLRRHAGEDNRVNGAVIHSILHSSGGIRFAADRVNLTFEAVTRSDKDAQSLSDVIRFFASMIQMQRQNQSNAALLASAIDTMKLTTGGNAVHLSLAVPEKALEQMLNQSATAGSVEVR